MRKEIEQFLGFPYFSLHVCWQAWTISQILAWSSAGVVAQRWATRNWPANGKWEIRRAWPPTFVQSHFFWGFRGPDPFEHGACDCPRFQLQGKGFCLPAGYVPTWMAARGRLGFQWFWVPALVIPPASSFLVGAWLPSTLQGQQDPFAPASLSTIWKAWQQDAERTVQTVGLFQAFFGQSFLTWSKSTSGWVEILQIWQLMNVRGFQSKPSTTRIIPTSHATYFLGYLIGCTRQILTLRKNTFS